MKNLYKNPKIKLTIQEPEHGWLPISFLYDDFKLELEISDVPYDPMLQLCDVLFAIISNQERKSELISWHLEPYCYYLQIEKIQKEYKLTIYESDELEFNTTDNTKIHLTKEISGTYNEIILPLYMSVKEFYAQGYTHPHWEEINLEKIERLKRIVKNKK